MWLLYGAEPATDRKHNDRVVKDGVEGRGGTLMRSNKRGWPGWLAAVVALICLPAQPAGAYSVLAHEAIVDRAWEGSIKPVLLLRFPQATPEQLAKARAYAYGGCAIQDLGYCPFSARYFSDLTHYVRSGAFVQALIRDAADLDEYAFALGALSHYAADSAGHSIAVNKSVPMLYPKLRARFGDVVTYEDDPKAHIRAEFGFDVIQLASDAYASNSYHRQIGFKVSKRLLECAFLETYGIELKRVLASVDLAIDSYTASVSSVIPEMSRVAWEMKKENLRKEFPGITSNSATTNSATINSFTGAAFSRNPEWRGYSRGPGPFARTTAFWFRIVPRVGIFTALGFKQPTFAAESLFVQSLDVTLDRYRELLGRVADGSLALENTNLDTGLPSRRGDYRLADQAYARLLNDLTRSRFRHASRELRDNIAAFYGPNRPIPTRRKA